MGLGITEGLARPGTLPCLEDGADMGLMPASQTAAHPQVQEHESRGSTSDLIGGGAPHLPGIHAGAISGARLIRVSVKKSASSVLRVENSETIAPLGPAWNQCNVSGISVYWSPGFRQTSCWTV